MSAVYFARFGAYVKIGFSSNPTERIKHLTGGGVILPDDLDPATPGELVLVIPFCRQRDESNMQMLFAHHWAAGEWFHWTPAFEHQMRTMHFVTHAERLKDQSRARRELGIRATTGVKEERWGKSTPERLADAGRSA